MRRLSTGPNRRFSAFPLVTRRFGLLSAPGGVALFGGFRRRSPQVALDRTTLTKAASVLTWLAAGFLLGRVSLFGRLHPFGLALVGAVAGLGAPLPALLTGGGCLLGLLSLGWTRAVAYLAALVLLEMVALRLDEGKAKRSPGAAALLQTGALVLVTTGLGRIGWEVLAERSFFDAGLLIFEALAAGALASLLQVAVSAAGRLGTAQKISREEMAGLILLATLLIAGLEGFGLGPLSLQDAAIRWLALTAAWAAGPGAGAVAGTVLGVAGLLLGNVPLYFVASYALAGALAGLFRDWGKPAVAGGFVLGLLILSYQVPDVVELTGALLATALALLAFSVTTPAMAAVFTSTWPGAGDRDDRRRAEVAKLREAFAHRLQDFSQVFRELARTFRTTPVAATSEERPDLARLMEAVADRACVSCAEATVCWKERFYLTYCEVAELMAKAEGKGRASLLDVPDGLRHCPQLHKVVGAVNHLLELNQLNSVWERKVTESKQLVYGQLTGVAELMESLAEEARLGQADLSTDLEERAQAVLRRHDVPVEHVLASPLGGERMAIEVVRRPCSGGEECRTRLPQLLTRAVGQAYSPDEVQCGRDGTHTYCRLKYLPERAYDVVTQVAKRALGDGPVCGDSHAVLDLPGGKVAVVLSDGMGIGPEAALESNAAIDVLTQLMKAGFEREFAVRTVNSILLLRSPAESFATVDMMLFDLYSGEAEFVKIGACPTYIRRDGEVHTVEAASLPAGILSAIDVEVSRRVLRPGDLVVMVTDGLLGGDALRANREGSDWVASALSRMTETDPAAVAQQLLAQARASRGEPAEDDMTVLVSQVRRRVDHRLPRPLVDPGRKACAV
ncbi:MAG: stage II sporulation protein E [Chitinophagales bacterium]